MKKRTYTPDEVREFHEKCPEHMEVMETREFNAATFSYDKVIDLEYVPADEGVEYYD